MNRRLKALICGVALSLPRILSAAEEEKTVVAAKTATLSTAELVSSFTTASFFSPVSFFRIQLGDNGSATGVAAGEDSEFETVSFSVTPTIATIDNNVEPVLVSGDVSLVIFGVESFNELDMIAKGITLTLDQTSVTSTEVVTGGPNTSSAVTGNGWTIAPYYVKELENGYLMDINAGFGKNSLNTSSGGVTATPDSTRIFVSLGLSTNEAISDSVYMQYKGAASYTYDRVGSYIQSDNSAVEASTTKLTQLRLGATVSKQMENVVPFVSGTLISNSFSAAGGSGAQPKEHSFTTLMRVGFNFSHDLIYGSLAFQGERDKSSTQFYIGYRF